MQGFGNAPAANANSSVDDGDRRGGGRRYRQFRGNGNRRGGDQNRDSQSTTSAQPAASSSSAAPAAAQSSFGRDQSLAEKTRQWARDTVRKHDKNGDMILDKEEQADLGQSKGADLNGDGKIVVDELYAATMSKSSGSSKTASFGTASSGSSGSSPSKSASAANSSQDSSKIVKKTTKRKSYRFTTAKERLPSWRFASKDANGDGQVAMSEYSRVWSDRTAAEFQRYDKDNDGMITAAEMR